MIIDTGITENELLASLLEDKLPAFDPRTMVSALMYSEASGGNKCTAMRKLREKAAAGELKEIRVRFANGQPGSAFVRP